MWEEEEEEEEDGSGWLEEAGKHSGKKKRSAEIPARCIISFFSFFFRLLFSEEMLWIPSEADGRVSERPSGALRAGAPPKREKEPPRPFYLLDLANERVQCCVLSLSRPPSRRHPRTPARTAAQTRIVAGGIPPARPHHCHWGG